MRLIALLGFWSKRYAIELQRDDTGHWYSRIRHSNGNKLWTSEAYSSKAEAMETARNFSNETGVPIKVIE